MAKSILSRQKDAAKKKLDRLLSTYPYVGHEAEIKPVIKDNEVRLEYTFVTLDPNKRSDLAKLFEKRGIIPVSDVRVIEPSAPPMASIKDNIIRERAERIVLSTKKYRAGSKRDKIRQLIADGADVDTITQAVAWRQDVVRAAIKEIAAECSLTYKF
jgi:hypothetical protein